MASETARARLTARYPEFGHQTAFLLQLVNRRSRREFNQALRDMGVEQRHVMALTVIAREPLTQRQLIDLLGVDKSSMVYIIDDLERLGLAERHRPENDRRSYRIHITDQGRGLLEKAAKLSEEVNERLFGPAGSPGRVALDELLWRLIDTAPDRDGA